MSRVGWAVLAIIVAGLAGFASFVSVGGGGPVRVNAVRRVAPAAPAPPPLGRLAVPVAGVRREVIRDSWGDAREGGARAHHGTDLPAPRGTPVLAAGAGTVEKLFGSARGGITLYERSADRRWMYYYAHLAGYAQGVHEGQAVRAGDPLGFVGDTGNAESGSTHLHFGLTRMAPGERWWQGEDVDPYPWLAGRRAPG